MMKKRILAYILTLAMGISLIPTFGITASADVGIAKDTANISVGDTVYYGKYPQSLLGTIPPSGTEGVDWVKSTAITTQNGYTEGTEYYFAIEPIAWRVLSNAGGKLFLLSEKNLDAGKPYNTTNTGIKWESSTIRKWLNGLSENPHDYSFIERAFPAKEQTAILTTTLDNMSHGGAGWQWPTDDKIFFLSIDDAQNSVLGFANDTSRIAVNTAYTAHFGAMQDVGVGDHWWLRSPGNIDTYAALVLNHGDIRLNGYRIDYDFVAARPAFKLNLSSVLFTSDAGGANAKSSAAVGGDLIPAQPAGDILKFTVLDSSLELGSVTHTATTGDTLTFAYTGATTEKILSAVILDDTDAVTYYGKLAATTAADGTADITLPTGFNKTTDTLKIFIEEANGDNYTDFASELKPLTILDDLAGIVSITGTAKYGEELTANTSGITSPDPLGELTYQWKRGATDIGTNSSTYTITSADIGETITVTVSATNYIGGLTSAATATVGKATPTIDSLLDVVISYGDTASIYIQGVSGGAYPTGTVSLTLDGTFRGDISLNSTAQATYPDFAATVPGEYEFIFSYSGDSNYEALTDVAGTLSVLADTTFVLVDVAGSPITYGDTVELVITLVDSQGRHLDGSVEIFVDDVSVGTEAAVGGELIFDATAFINAGTHTIKVEYGGDIGYTASEHETELTIAQAAGTFAALTAQSATYTTALTLADITLPNGYAWTIPATAITAVGDGQSFPATFADPSGNYTTTSGAITVNVAKAVPTVADFDFTPTEVTYDGNPKALTVTPKLGVVGMGAVTVKYDGSTDAPTNAGVYTITIDVADGTNYTAAAGLALGTFTINKATPSITFPTASTITYGALLSTSTLTGGSTEYGSFAWADGSVIPGVVNSGYTVNFTPSAETLENYEDITTTTATVAIIVNKATGAFGSPSAVGATYTTTLTLADLTLPAGYAWKDSTTAITAAGDGQSFAATYTDPSGNYEAATGNITVNVAKAAAPTITFPTASAITYGALLSTSTLTGGSTEYGSFAWTDGSVTPGVVNSRYSVTFTPDDTANYDYSSVTLTAMVEVTVNKHNTAVLALEQETFLSQTAGRIKATLTNAYGGNGGKTVVFSVNGVDYERDTDENGIAGINVNLNVGEYTITATFEDDANSMVTDTFEYSVIKREQAPITLYGVNDFYFGETPFSPYVEGGETDILHTEYSYESLDGITYPATLTMPEAIGEYKITATMPGTTQFNDAITTDTFYILANTGNNIISVFTQPTTWNGTGTPADPKTAAITVSNSSGALKATDFELSDYASVLFGKAENPTENVDVALSTGSNTIYVIATAQDGTTTAYYTLTITRQSSGSSGGTSSYTITFEYRDGDELIKSERASYVRNKALTAADLKIPESYELAQDSFSLTVTKNETVKIEIKKIEATPTPTPEMKEKPYISGYPDGTFKPDGEITRAEIMQMLYNMVGDKAVADLSVLAKFSDMENPHWADTAIAWAVTKGFIGGYPDGRLAPDDFITRAELAAVLNRVAQRENLFGELGMAQVTLTDIEGHWAYDDIMALAGKGIILGYPDNTFRPDNAVTRAETVTMFSRLFNRSDGFKTDKTFSDVTADHWAYKYIMNAANGI